MVRFRRKHAILIAAAGLIASTAALIGLRIGRPVYYSDGNRAFAASELRHASMLRWGAPQPEFALPGPVRGRVAQLPDGRLLYGRVRSPRRTDLVLFDPEFPAQEPEPVLALCSEAHDLSPVVTGDGTCTVWFASDRGSGAGGFDLYRADYHQGVFYGVAPLDLAGVNTIFDETDPAADVGGGQLVFVRRDPGLIEGRNATLWIASLAGSFEARVLLEPVRETGRVLPALDRDPAFSPGGKALYFVRQHPLEEPVLMQTFRHRGRWVKPLPVEIVEAGTTADAMRGPALLAGGFDLRLVHSSGSGSTGGEALTYRSRAREVRPYWDGQAYIENLLVSLVLFFLTLLALLTLGARWHHLDLITKLFLVSVVIHLLLLFWLSRMEIVRSFLPDQPQPGQLQVTILAAAHGDRTPGTEEVVAQTANVSQQVAFDPEESALDAAAPGVEIGRQQRQLEHSLAAARRPELRPALTTDAEGVAEGAPVVATRTGRSQDVAVSPARIAKARPGRFREMAARQQQQQPGRRIEVTTPGSDIPATAAPPRHRSVPGANNLTARAPLPQPRTQGPEPQTLHDPPAPQAARTRTAQVDDDITPLVGKTATRTTPTPAVVIQRPGTPGTQGEQRAADLDAKPSASLLARNKSGASLPPVPPAGMTTPVAEPRTIEPGGLALKDSLETRPNNRRGAMAKAATEASASSIPGSTLDAVSQARPGASVPAPKPDHGVEQPMASTSGPAPPSLLGAAAGRRQPGPLAAKTMPPGRAFPHLARFKDLRDLPARTDGTATQPGTSTRSAPAAAPLAAAVLSELAPLKATATPERHHPDRGMAITGGLRIPGSFLERATRRPQLPGSSSALAALDAGLFRNRFGSGKAAALRKYGGGEDTERAVRLGLDYLASIQNRDGSWGRRSKHRKYGRVQVGKTALCLLAFLGAGHTHQSRSKHRKVAKNALAFLLRVQDDATGHFGATSTYSHGIATYALAECYAMTRDKELQAPLEYAVTWTLVNQNHTRDRRNRGGWGYFSPSLRPEDSYARAATTAWQVMALKSAQLSGIKVSGEHLRLAEQFLWRCYDRRNRYFLYTHKPSRLRTSWRTLPASTPASCFCLLLLGNDPDDARLRAGLEYTVDRRPRRFARASSDQFVRRAAGNVYFWYYGSLATFMAGGDDWRTWNRALKRVLLRAQSDDGSFKPIDVYADYAGDNDRDRSYTTAMCVLSLEVYYRYFTPLLKGR